MADNFKDLSEKYKQQLMNTYGKRSMENNKSDYSFFPSAVPPDNPAPTAYNEVASDTAPADSKIDSDTPASDNQTVSDTPLHDIKNTPPAPTANQKRFIPPDLNSELHPPEPIFEEEKEPVEEFPVTDYSEFLKKNDVSPPVSERFPKPTLPDFIRESVNECTGTGFLRVRVSAADSAVPIEKALVTVTQNDNILYSLHTDQNGDTSVVEISTPCSDPDIPQSKFAVVDIGVYYKDFYSQIIKNAAIFDNIKSLQIVNLIPLPLHSPPEQITYNSTEPSF